MITPPSLSWWIGASPDGYTAVCKARHGEFITADSTDGITLLQQRAEMLSALEGLRQSKVTRGIRHANQVSRN